MAIVAEETQPVPYAMLERFATNHGLTVAKVRKLCRQSDEVGRLGTLWSNEGNKHEPAYFKAQEAFGKLATAYGFEGYEMNGLYPTLVKSGADVYLPE